MSLRNGKFSVISSTEEIRELELTSWREFIASNKDAVNNSLDAVYITTANEYAAARNTLRTADAKKQQLYASSRFSAEKRNEYEAYLHEYDAYKRAVIASRGIFQRLAALKDGLSLQEVNQHLIA